MRLEARKENGQVLGKAGGTNWRPLPGQIEGERKLVEQAATTPGALSGCTRAPDAAIEGQRSRSTATTSPFRACPGRTLACTWAATACRICRKAMEPR